jgi:hypothetical protein
MVNEDAESQKKKRFLLRYRKHSWLEKPNEKDVDVIEIEKELSAQADKIRRWLPITLSRTYEKLDLISGEYVWLTNISTHSSYNGDIFTIAYDTNGNEIPDMMSAYKNKFHLELSRNIIII